MTWLNFMNTMWLELGQNFTLSQHAKKPTSLVVQSWTVRDKLSGIILKREREIQIFYLFTL